MVNKLIIPEVKINIPVPIRFIKIKDTIIKTSEINTISKAIGFLFIMGENREQYGICVTNKLGNEEKYYYETENERDGTFKNIEKILGV